MYNNHTSTRSRRRSSSAARNRSRKYSGGTKDSNRRNHNSKPRRRGQYINPERFVKAAKPVKLTVYAPKHSFEDFKINDLLKRNLRSRGYEFPTQIQDKAMPLGLEGKDVIGVANTGTGKTASFLLPLLNNLMVNRSKKALIIAPTRELAQQISKESRVFSRGGKIYDTLLIGGVSIRPQLNDLHRNPQVIIGTPGRIKDHLERGSLRLDLVSTIVLDEVDRMLDMGFIKDIRMILGKLPEKRQSFFFSATLSSTIDGLIRTFTQSPVTVMAKTAETSDNVEQSVVRYNEKTDKMNKLHDLLISEEAQKTLIFCETKYGSDRLSKELVQKGFTSDAMHGNKSQGQRQRALRKFSGGEVEILVATDVAARGIDVNGITHVINYDIPHTYDDYTHRIGRTGRGNNIGHAVTFVAV